VTALNKTINANVKAIIPKHSTRWTLHNLLSLAI